MSMSKIEKVADTVTRISNQIFFEGTGSDIHEMTLKRLEGQVPEAAVEGCATQILCMAAASAGACALAGLSEDEFRGGMKALGVAFLAEIETQIDMAKKMGLFE